MNTELILKLLHTTLKLPVMIFDAKFKLKKSMPSNFSLPFVYDFKLMIDTIESINKKYRFSFYYGVFNEVFILYKYEENYISFGPFRCNVIEKGLLYEKFTTLKIPTSEREKIYRYLDELTFFSLTDCKYIITLINYIFTGILEDLFHDSIYNHLSSIEDKITSKKIETLINHGYSSNNGLIEFEKQLSNLLNNSNNSENLSKIPFLLSNYPRPTITGDILRSEKNYSIILFEKLSQALLQVGLDFETVVQSRNMFINESEKTKDLNNCLIVRESALTYYVDKLKQIKNNNYSSLILSIINYIEMNLYRNITTKEISDKFDMSISNLCFLFKKELNMTIKNYILKQKISLAKSMIQESYSMSDIALSLGFSDSAHFSRSFKKITGQTPRQFKQAIFKNK